VNKGIVGFAGAILALSWSQSTFAQQANCRDLTFTGPIAREFPNARDACLDVVTRPDGRQYAHFQARVRNVRGNTVEAEFKMPDGSYGRPVSVTPDSGSRVRIGGRSYRFNELARGQELDVYLPPDRWEIAVASNPEVDFAAAEDVTLFVLAQPTQTVAANTLPRTASPLPLIGALGGALTVLGFGVAAIRRRWL
jgi:hypothetical protein